MVPAGIAGNGHDVSGGNRILLEAESIQHRRGACFDFNHIRRAVGLLRLKRQVNVRIGKLVLRDGAGDRDFFLGVIRRSTVVR